MRKNTPILHETTLENLLKKYKTFYHQPVIKLFLQNEDNYQLIISIKEKSTPKKIEELNHKFKSFYYKARVYKYISSLIQLYSIDFDKRERKRREKVRLILDKPMGEDESESTNILNILKLEDKPIEDNLQQMSDLSSVVSDEKLLNIISGLSSKQYKVLTMKYIKELKIKDIAEYFGETPQNISKIHKQAINKIRKNYIK